MPELVFRDGVHVEFSLVSTALLGVGGVSQ